MKNPARQFVKKDIHSRRANFLVSTAFFFRQMHALRGPFELAHEGRQRACLTGMRSLNALVLSVWTVPIPESQASATGSFLAEAPGQVGVGSVCPCVGDFACC